MKKNSANNYYLGLDIGTNSVGYAVTNESYDLLKFRGEPMWGSNTFDTASLAEARRLKRTERRRLDRRQQRVQLLIEIFAPEICKIDRNFFIRRKESALFSDDNQYGVKIFDGGITDRDYHKTYPTIHHLIFDLMNSDEPRDIRLIFLACAWLVANRGHFLYESEVSKIKDFTATYDTFCSYLTEEYNCSLPWDDIIQSDTILEIMKTETSISNKKILFEKKVFNGKKPSNKPDEGFPFRRDILIALLAGGKISPKDLFCNEEYNNIDSVSLNMDEENFVRIITDLGKDGTLLKLMRNMYDCALLNTILPDTEQSCISKAKIDIYEQHAKDLKWLKYFIHKYKPNDYSKIFRDAESNNYAAYSYNIKNCKNGSNIKKKATKEEFNDFLKKEVSSVKVEEIDRTRFEDMINRIEMYSFLPKQKNKDNRVIPQQLYRFELETILNRAEQYIPMLKESDGDGFTNKQKILSIFDFKIPYYVGPLNRHSNKAWLTRKSGKIYPWNFNQMVDLDSSEELFIRRMTNSCSYLPGEDVLPYCSLLYSKFMVLNELNNLKINQHSIPVAVKQELYTNLFENSPKKVTKKSIENYLKSRGYINSGDEISGIDINLNSNLRPYHCFKYILSQGILNIDQVEDIINHAAYSEDKSRMLKWLKEHYPMLSENDRKYISQQKLKEFGRLSKKLLTGIIGSAKYEPENTTTIIDALWNTNNNFMQLLSDRYTFSDCIKEYVNEYYADPLHKKCISERLSDMYISNAVKRPIIRALNIVSDVVKATGKAPEKIFVEMARNVTTEKKGKRTLSRKHQILDLYKQIKDTDLPRLITELEDMGEMANENLQSDKLFLYYMQLGKCMYSGKPINLSNISSETYNIDHIYPKSKVQDDSVLNNKVLVLSEINGNKDDIYPVDADIRKKMTGFWLFLKNNNLITDEKFRRLTRSTSFTEDELHQFINRQLTETRQSTKAIAQLLKENYPDTEIVYVKAGMVSEFRHEFNILKCRSINDYHHAKDAYLNIVVGNVYNEIFTRRWFDTNKNYSVNIKAIFKNTQKPYGNAVWNGSQDIAKIKSVIKNNNIHITQYQYCRHSGQNGGLFDQNPLKAKEGLIPLKSGMNTAKYGGYNGTTSTFFLLVGFKNGKKKEIMFFPVDLMFADKILDDNDFAISYITDTLTANKKTVSEVYFPIGKRILKINTVLSLNGFLVCLSSGSIKDGRIGFLPLTQFICDYDTELYIKHVEKVVTKKKEYDKYIISPEYDKISAEENNKIFDLFIDKLNNSIFSKRPGADINRIAEKKKVFEGLSLDKQCECIMKMMMIFTRQPNDIDLSDIGLSNRMFKSRKSMYLSGWKKEYKDVRIIDSSASGLFTCKSENLLTLL